MRRCAMSWLQTVLVAALIAAAILFTAGADEAAPAGESAPKEETFQLKEVSAFELDASSPRCGQSAEISDGPAAEVKKYPALKSGKPIYGALEIRRTSATERGTPYHFVFDESGGTGKGYDRLYFDLEADMDLSNDEPVGLLADVPKNAVFGWQGGRELFFGHLDVLLDFGPDLGRRPFRLLPRLFVPDEGGQGHASFVAVSARQGRIRIGKQPYMAMLAQPYLLTGRYDRPTTWIELIPLGEGHKEWWWGADSISAMRPVDGTWYTTAVSPLGDKLIVRPYGGDLGVFEVGLGDRKVTEFGAAGSLTSATSAVPVGKPGENGDYEAAQRSVLPVGDYRPNYLTVNYGSLRISMSHNYHSEGGALNRDRPPVYGITIRKDKPFVMDFSNPPAIMFAGPAAGTRFKPGDDVRVEAVLIDPKLDIMIRRLDALSVEKKADREVRRWDSIDPTVVVTDSAGKQVASGTMPFG